jgi:hypothetical protein
MPALDVNATQWRRGSRSIDVACGVKAAVARRTVMVRDYRDLATGSWSSSHGRRPFIAGARGGELARGVG